jgi:hypothetical protein
VQHLVAHLTSATIESGTVPTLRALMLCTSIAFALLGMVQLRATADVTITGEVVDIASATTRGADGWDPGEAAAMLRFAKEGRSMGILTDDRLYEVTGAFAANRNARLLDFVARRVVVTGTVTETGDRPRINITTIRLTTLFPQPVAGSR